jgi:glutamate carboxypeptidase
MTDLHANTIDGLQTWLRTESPTHAAAAVNRMMDLVEAEVAGAPIAVERVPGRDGLGDSVILRAGPANGQGAGVVLSHLDTVHPLGTAERDLPVRIEGDRLYGPGAYDMKGGAYLALQAFKEAARQESARPLVFLLRRTRRSAARPPAR